jgi:uncharacterized protein with beta-barrel porin domain
MTADHKLATKAAWNPLGHTRFLPGQALAFAGTGESFAVSGVPLGADSAVIQAALDFALSPDAMLSIGYDGTLSAAAQDHAIRGGVSWKF